jgi:hypothetical protein
MKKYLAVLLLLPLLPACKSKHSPVDPDEAKKACAGAADAAATLETIAASLRAAVPAPDEKLGFDGPAPVLGDGGNTILVGTEALDVPGAESMPAIAWDFAPDAMVTLTVARTGIDGYGTKVEYGELPGLREKCDRIGAARYVLIVHTAEHKLAYGARGDTFVPGAMSGSAHLYELATGRHLGGFATRATSSESVEALVGPDNSGNRSLEEDLERNYWLEILGRFQQLGGA